MLAIFIILIALLLFVGGIVCFKHTKSRRAQDEFATASAVGLVALIAALVIFCHVFVPTNHAGIINSFGKNDPSRHYNAGFNLKWPWEKISFVDLSFEDMSYVRNEEGAYEVIQAVTTDNIVLEIPLTFSWAVGPTRVAEVKSLLPDSGIYTAALYYVTRSSVRDVVSRHDMAYVLANRDVLAKELAQEITADTALHFASQGYDNPQEIIRFGRLTLRGVYPPSNVTEANAALLSAETEARIAAERTRVPADRSVEDYVAVQEAQTARAAVDNGNPVTIVMGDAQAVAVAGARR